MRVLIALLLAIVVTAAPAAAGTADDPEIIDPCGQLAPTDPQYVQPANDLCAAWFGADVTGAAPVLSVTIRTLEPTVEQARVVQASWTAGDCRWRVTYDDAAASPRPVPIGDVGDVFPYSYPVQLSVRCDPYERPCDPDPVVIDCTEAGYERSGYAELPADSVVVDGTDVTLTLDLAGLDPSGDEVDGATFAAGDTLTDLRVHAATAASSLFVPGGGYIASAGSTGVSVTTSDLAVGEAYTLPVPDASS